MTPKHIAYTKGYIQIAPFITVILGAIGLFNASAPWPPLLITSLSGFVIGSFLTVWFFTEKEDYKIL